MTPILNKGHRRRRHHARAVALVLALGPAVAALGACGTTTTTGGDGVQVVAAENVWGSIAAQVGGAHAHVVSVISSPDVDPHAYEPTPQDARTIAQAQYVVVDGAGYDPWMPKLLDANPSDGRRVLTVADLAGRGDGDNPHMWYSPSVVLTVVARIASDLGRLDPADAASFDRQAAAFTSAGLARYDALRASIRSRFGGAPVGSTESIFVDMSRDLGLDLVTPPDYMKAVAEGTDPTTADKSTFDAQISGHAVRVLVFNRQNATTDVRTLVDRARSAGIPVVAITETLDPASASFQDWQAGQLETLQAALARAAGR